MKAQIFAFLIFLFLPLTAHAQGVNPPKHLTINTEHYPPHSRKDGTGFEDMLAKEVFGRLGIDITLNFLPSERTLVNANAGLDDGILSRVGGMTAKYPNLVQFREPVQMRDYVAFVRRKDIKVTGWESLKPYNIGIIRGWKLLERNIKNTKSLVKVGNSKQLFMLLDSGRVDLIVFARLSGLHMVKTQNYKEIRSLEPPLARREVFFYLNSKHKDLIDPASNALRQIKEDGSYQRIYEKVISPLLSD